MTARRKGSRKKFDVLGRRLRKRRGPYKGLRDYILKQLDYTAPMGTMGLYQVVVDDFGTVILRNFYKHLAEMREDGSIMFKLETRQGGFLYTRPRR
jgi:hypothetical protein